MSDTFLATWARSVPRASIIHTHTTRKHVMTPVYPRPSPPRARAAVPGFASRFPSRPTQPRRQPAARPEVSPRPPTDGPPPRPPLRQAGWEKKIKSEGSFVGTRDIINVYIMYILCEKTVRVVCRNYNYLKVWKFRFTFANQIHCNNDTCGAMIMRYNSPPTRLVESTR